MFVKKEEFGLCIKLFKGELIICSYEEYNEQEKNLIKKLINKTGRMRACEISINHKPRLINPNEIYIAFT